MVLFDYSVCSISCLILAVITPVIFLAFYYFTLGSWNRESVPRTIPSPRETLLPYLSPDQASKLPYPPNILPGARNVDSPYGIMRVYEWGPENGMKVVMVHGDTTPAPVLGPLAELLVERGCRVIMFDLWGRGYSDAPVDVPYDTRLLTIQIFIAIASSPLSWTGATSDGFSVIGYSLGGGIVMAFAAHFPYLVNSIILLAPGGILRYKPKVYNSIAFRYPSIVPLRYLRKLIGRYLGVYLHDRPYSRTADSNSNSMQEESTASATELGNLDVPAIVRWQFEKHQGFLHGFLSTSQHGPITHQHHDWSRVCGIVNGDSKGISDRPSKLYDSRFLVIFGESDDIVKVTETSEELYRLLGGRKHVEIKSVPGSHGFPYPFSRETGEHICDFWELKSHR